MDAEPAGPSFSFLCELILAIGKVRPRPARARPPPKDHPPKATQLLHAWIARVKSDTDAASFARARPVTHFFRLFFPEEGARRRSVADNSELGRAAGLGGVLTLAFSGMGRDADMACRRLR